MSYSFEGICIGDLHLDKPNLKVFENPLELQMKSLSKAYEYARTNGIKNVFFLGDICEYPELSESARVALISALKTYDDQGFHQFLYLGNHDYAYQGSHSIQTILEIHKRGYFRNLTVTDGALDLSINKVPVSLLSYPFKTPNTSKSRLCFAHYEVSGAIGDNGRKSSSEDELEEDNHQYIQGHLHTEQTVKNHWYPGTMYQLSFGERTKKGIGRFKATYNNGKVSLKKKHISWEPVFKFVNLNIETQEDFKLIQKSDTTKYKVFISEDVVIPENFHLKYPNVVNSTKYSSKEELSLLENEELIIEDTKVPLLSPRSLLPKYLKKTLGLKPAKIEKVLEAFDSLEIKKHD